MLVRWPCLVLLYLSSAFSLPLIPNSLEVDGLNSYQYAVDKINDVENNSLYNEGRLRKDPRTLGLLIDIYRGGLLAGLSLLQDVIESAKTNNESRDLTELTTVQNKFIETSTFKLPLTTTEPPSTTTLKTTSISIPDKNIDIIITSTEKNILKLKEDLISNDVEIIDITTEISNSTLRNENQQSEEESEEEETPGGVVGGLISTFLSGLSKPDGGVDLEALVGLVGGLSVQKEDGSYDFSGLTELLMGFLGGEEGGGSDVGSFIGGLLGATIQGLAKPPGATGAGIFTGKVLNGILPGLSAPPPPKEGNESKPEGGLDSGGFLSGLLSTILGGSSSGTNTNSTAANPLIQIKQGLFKSVFKLISSILGASSNSGHIRV